MNDPTASEPDEEKRCSTDAAKLHASLNASTESGSSASLCGSKDVLQALDLDNDEKKMVCLKSAIRLCYVLAALRGIFFPFVKICLIAMTEKLLRASLQQDIDEELYEQLEDNVFDVSSSSPIVDAFLMKDLSLKETYAMAAALTCVVTASLAWSKSLHENFLNYAEVKRLQLLVYQKFIMEPNNIAINEASDLLYTKIAAVEKYWSETKYKKVDDLSTIATSLFLILLLSWDLGLACIVGAILIFGVSGWIWNTLSTPYYENRMENSQKANSLLLDLIQCKDIVLIHAQERKEQERLRNIVKADQNDIKHLSRAKLVSDCFITGPFTMITPSIIMLVYKFDLSMERVFQLLILIVLLDEFMRAFLASTYHPPIETEYQRAKDTFCHVLGMEEEELFPREFIKLWPDPEKQRCRQEMADEKKARETRRSSLRELTKHISNFISKAFEAPQMEKCDKILLEDVSFGYKKKDGTTCTIIEHLNMELQVGEHYAIMGETGVGKSTLFKAISGLHEPLSGNIYFDGDAVDPTSVYWREKVAVVGQHAVFLNRSLRENLCYGLPVADTPTDDQIWEALDKVKMRSRIQSMPEGLDLVMEDNGSQFSGGQRQRLQIARLLLSSCPLVLLDECTSALDPDTTQEVLEVLRQHMVGKTMIMITHDVNTLFLAKHVLEMKPGGYVERVKAQRVASIFGRVDGRRKSELLKELETAETNTIRLPGAFEDISASEVSEVVKEEEGQVIDLDA